MKYNLLAVFPVGFSWSIGTVGYLSADTVPTDCLSGTKHSSKHDSEQSPIHQPVSHFSVSLSPHLEGGGGENIKYKLHVCDKTNSKHCCFPQNNEHLSSLDVKMCLTQ